MSLNTGNLVRKATNILGMQLGKFMQSPKIWLPTFQLIGKSFLTLYCCSLSIIVIFCSLTKGIAFLGPYFIDMQMKMFLWVHGSLVLMWNTLMIGASAVALHLVRNHYSLRFQNWLITSLVYELLNCFY